MGETRHGIVSNVDYDTGRIKVTYKDKNDSVSPWLEFFSFNGEYKPPCIGSSVIVLVFDNSNKGVALGGYYNQKTVLPNSGKGVFVKELGTEIGEAYMLYQDGKISIKAEDIEFKLDKKTVNLKEIIEKVGLWQT